MGGGGSKKAKDKKPKDDGKSAAKSSSDAADHILKLLLIGDASVALLKNPGKSALILRYTDNTFTESFIPTIGVEYKSKKLPIGGDNVEVQLFDTAGQERFRVMTASYYRQGAGVFIVFDVTNKDTFDNVKQWVEQIDRYAKDGTLKFLVGNKIDEAKRVVTTDQGKALAEELGMQYYETSAKENKNIDEMMGKVAKACLDAKEKD